MSLRRSPSSLLALFGTATLVAGTVTGINVGCTSAPDSCTIILSRNTPGGTLGFLTAPTSGRSTTNMTITSTNAADVSTVNWMAIPKNVGLAASTSFTNNASLRRGPSGIQVQKGRATLVAGTKTVTGIPFGPTAIVFAMAADFGGTSGKLSVPTATVDSTTGTFVINSNQAADTSVVDWVVINRILRFDASGRVFSQARGDLSGTTVFTKMNPLNETDTCVLASVITPTGTSGNLSAPLVERVRGDGSIGITPSTADTSNIEVVLF